MVAIVSGTSSNFTIDLPETFQLEENMLCQTREVSIPHSWYSINENNDNFYVMKGILPPETGRGFACDFSWGSLVTSQFGSLVTSFCCRREMQNCRRFRKTNALP